MKTAAFLLAFVICATAMSCTPARPAHVVPIFVDVSASAKYRAAYRDAWLKISAALRPGDRVIFAEISDHTYTGFRPTIDQEIPSFSYWQDNKLVHESRVAALNGKFRDSLEHSLQVARSRKTDIFGAFLAAQNVREGTHCQSRT